MNHHNRKVYFYPTTRLNYRSPRTCLFLVLFSLYFLFFVRLSGSSQCSQPTHTHKYFVLFIQATQLNSTHTIVNCIIGNSLVDDDYFVVIYIFCSHSPTPHPTNTLVLSSATRQLQRVLFCSLFNNSTHLPLLPVSLMKRTQHHWPFLFLLSQIIHL